MKDIFDNKFYDNEVRDGFFVSSLIKRDWAAQMQVLLDVDKVCKENNITYFADYGTLLGAIRHKGFIPWDDDIDICMLREDYEKFCKLAPKFLDENYKIYNVHNSLHTQSITRINNNDKIDFTEIHLNIAHGFPYVAGIDLFPLDYIPEEGYEDFVEKVDHLVNSIKYIKNNDKEKLSEEIYWIEREFNLKIDDSDNILNNLYVILDNYLREISHKKTDKLMDIFEWSNNRQKYRNAEDYKEAVYFKFENIEIPVPVGYKNVLKRLYNDYMTPIIAANTHEYPSFLKQEEYLFKQTGNRYGVFQKEDISERNRFNSKTAKEELNNLIGIINEVNNIIIDELEKNNKFIVFDYLQKCQDFIIRIGNTIEYKYKSADVEKIVPQLEELCENIFDLVCYLENDYIQEFIHSFRSMLERWRSVVSEIQLLTELKDNKIIAIIFRGEKDWSIYEKIYSSLVRNEGYKCLAISVPFFERKNDGSIGDMIEYYENDKYHFESYNIIEELNLNIDVAIVSDPYENYNLSGTIHPQFYVSELQKRAKCILHIPTEMIMDYDSDIYPMCYMSRHFITVPGVVGSDYIMVRTQELQQRYIDKLEDFTNDLSWKDRVKNYNNDIDQIVKYIINLVTTEI